MTKLAPDCRPIYLAYIVFRPTGVPCYVGKGKGKRWLHSVIRSNNSHLYRISKKYNFNLPVVVIRDGLTEAQAFDLEVKLIAAIGRMDNGEGPLVNRTDGGEGTSGYKHTAEAREKTRKAAIGKQKRLGAILSNETKKKISISNTGKKKSAALGPKTRQRMLGNTNNSGRTWITDGKNNHLVYPSDEIPVGWYRGRVFSEIGRNNIVIAATGNRFGDGNKANSGRCWVTDGTLNQFLAKDIAIPDGWYLGRTI